MKAYVIADVQINDPVLMEEYVKLAGESLAPYQWKPIVFGGAVEAAEGNWNPKHLVVLEFQSPAEPAAFDPTPARQSIAVLPFINLSADPEHDEFEDGITADILSQPAKIHDAERAGLVSVGGSSRDRAAFWRAARQARDEHLEIEEP